MCIIVQKLSCEVNVDKEGLLVIGEGMMTDSRNQSPENSKVPFHESDIPEGKCESMHGSILFVTSRVTDG